MNKVGLVRRLLNPLMLWGAGLGWVIAAGLVGIQETWRHVGPGIVWYGEEGPDWSQVVSESQYKRHNYVMNGLLLGTGLLFWVLVATQTTKPPAPRSD